VELAAAAIVAVALGVAAWLVTRCISRLEAAAREDASRARILRVLELFAPAVAAASDDARAIVTWRNLATRARLLFPSEFDALDRASGGTFPFTAEDVQAAHARWTADWLSWEGAHDAEYKLKAARLEEELGEAKRSGVGRARLEAVEREKLERYQRRYEDYTRVSRALQALDQSASR
jgi:hypothetical protein